MVVKKIVNSFLLMTGILLLSSCGNNKNGETQVYTKLVKTASVEKISGVEQKQFPSVIEEAEEFNMAFRVAGPIQKIYVKEGEYVKKGQLVAEMDTRDYMIQKNAVEAQVSQLQKEYERVKELYERKSVSENDYEKMKAGIEMAEQKLKNANDQINDTKLYAPFTGYITKVMFKDGSLVNHGTPIATLIDVSQFKVEINVPANIYINKSNIKKIECTQESIPGEVFPLTLYSENIKANNNGLYKLYLYHNPASGSKLAPGMNVSVKLYCEKENNAMLSIPAQALFEIDSKSFVWVVNDSVVNAREVQTNNQLSNGHIGIVSGLSENEEVVTGGLNLLKEGEKVRVVAPESKSNVGNLL